MIDTSDATKFASWLLDNSRSGYISTLVVSFRTEDGGIGFGVAAPNGADAAVVFGAAAIGFEKIKEALLEHMSTNQEEIRSQGLDN